MGFSENAIYCGDNLQILRSFPDACIDLCYIDPPFFSRRNHVDISKATAEVRGFQDTWNGDFDAYISFMRERVQEIHRVLKPSGSFYLHCDVSAVFHLKVACDDVFGMDSFLNDIIWKRHSPSKNTDRNYGSITDHVLFYAKGQDYTFNVQYIPMDDAVFNIVEETSGRRFRSQPLVVRGNQEGKTFRFGDRSYTIKKGKALKWTQETIDRRLAKNPQLIYWTAGGEPRYKTYLDESKGIKLTSLWADIKLVTSTSSERLAYPTQKPIKFMERIVAVSSNPGDVVLDAFCGSGTTLLAAKNLGRAFVGIDASATACRLAASRVTYPVERIEGHPSSVEDLAAVPAFEFLNWICWKLNASRRHDVDAGDAMIATCRHTKVPVLAKQAPAVDAGDVETLAGIISQAKNEGKGLLVGLAFDDGIDEAIEAINERDGITITRYTIEDVVTGKPAADGHVLRTTLF